MRKVLPVAVYFVGLIISFLIFSWIWSTFVVGNLYFSTDPIYFFDIIPPFVNSKFGEYFVINKILVWILWFVFIMLIVSIPYVFTKKLKKEIL